MLVLWPELLNHKHSMVGVTKPFSIYVLCIVKPKYKELQHKYLKT